MKRYGIWQTILTVLAVCLALSACGGAIEETAEETAEEAPADIEQALEPQAPETGKPQEAGEDATQPAIESPKPTPTTIAPTPAPDFGSIAYDVPQNMVRAEPVQVILLVSPSEEADLVTVLEEELGEVGQDPDNVQTAVIEVAKYMSATLVGAPQEAFEIVPLQEKPKQQLRDDEPTQWEWTVVPKMGGTHRLILRIDRLVEREGEEELFKEEVHRDDVTVVVPVALRLQDAWGSFDIKWLAGVLLFPLFFYWLNRRDRSRENSD